jgi:hypothetical protein
VLRTAFLRVALQDRYDGMWLLAATTGMRRSELAGVTIEMLDLDAGVLRIEDTRVVVAGKAVVPDGKSDADQGLDAGPETIAWHLAHHHDITVSRATVARHLTARGMVTPEPKKRPKSSYIRFEASMPNQC